MESFDFGRLFVEQRDGDGHCDPAHPAGQQHGGFCTEQISFPRPRSDLYGHDQHLDGAAFGRARSGLSGDHNVGWNNNLLGIIVPAAATPTGVFLLRQYMLTIPDELIDAARIDGASEWRIYAQVIVPLAKPALAVLTIFSVMWRWNDFLWPLIVLSRSEYFTLQIGSDVFSRRAQCSVESHPGNDRSNASADYTHLRHSCSATLQPGLPRRE